MIGRITFLCLLTLCISCTSTKMGQAQIQKEFETTEFELARPMYLITHLSCGILKGVYENELAEVKSESHVDRESIIFFERYKGLNIGDKNCDHSKNFRTYDLLGEGKIIRVSSIRDVLNASWWFWEIKGAIEINGKFRPFRMELAYEKNKPLRTVLSEVFRIEK